MTRTDVVASSRPRKADAAPIRKSSSAVRRLLVLPVALALMVAFVLPTTALAADTTSTSTTEGYTPKTTTTTTTVTTTTPATTPTTTPTSTPTTTPTTAPTPSSGTSPEKQSSTPEKSTAPEKAAEPTTSTSPTAKKASTLPFTGLDLRWLIAGGVLLMAMGLSIVAMQRRHRGGSR